MLEIRPSEGCVMDFFLPESDGDYFWESGSSKIPEGVYQPFLPGFTLEEIPPKEKIIIESVVYETSHFRFTMVRTDDGWTDFDFFVLDPGSFDLVEPIGAGVSFCGFDDEEEKLRNYKKRTNSLPTKYSSEYPVPRIPREYPIPREYTKKDIEVFEDYVMLRECARELSELKTEEERDELLFWLYSYFILYDTPTI